ncbi:glycosyl transferase [Deltaproteobacteria bacterium]|nr:glycosyl transferase [Deltaproteobacteria bacterium]
MSIAKDVVNLGGENKEKVMTKVSIIIPCYNDGKYLPEAIASAKAQTYSNGEIIVIDDHSTDVATLDVLREMATRGVTVLQTPLGKKGAAAARNTGIQAAIGEFILPLDADDKIEPSYVEKAVAVLDSRPAVGICYCKARMFGLKHGSWKLPLYSWDNILMKNMIFATALFRRADWAAVGGYDETLTIGLEDYAFWLHIISLGREVYSIEEELFFYRVKSGSRTTTFVNDAQNIAAFKALFKSCETIFSNNALSLFLSLHHLKEEKDDLNRLFFWKLFQPLFLLERKLRQITKKLIGRA